MFTGIVQTLGHVFSIKIVNDMARLVIEVKSKFAQHIDLGASISINGVCLTVVEQHQINNQLSHIAFDVIDETLNVTNLSTLTEGDVVCFERSLKVGDEIGGHIVSGHIHCTAQLIDIKKQDSNTRLTFTLIDEENSHFQRYLFEKGFIAINGISLTLGKVTQNSFIVHLIPETLERTNLSRLSITDTVNIEFDQQTMTIVKTIERLKLTLH